MLEINAAALTLFEKDIEEFIDHTQIKRGFAQSTADGRGNLRPSSSARKLAAVRSFHRFLAPARSGESTAEIPHVLSIKNTLT